jgi:hypothetical protein
LVKDAGKGTVADVDPDSLRITERIAVGGPGTGGGIAARLPQGHGVAHHRLTSISTVVAKHSSATAITSQLTRRRHPELLGSVLTTARGGDHYDLEGAGVVTEGIR